MGTIVHTQQELDAALAGCAGDIIIDSPGGVLLRVGGYGKVWRVGGESCVDVGDSAKIEYVGGSATIRDVRDSAKIEYVGGSAKIRDVRGSATIQDVGGSAKIQHVRGSATIEYVRDSAKIEYVGGSATIRDVRDSATIEYVGGSATIQHVRGSATIEYVRDSATIRDVRDSATIQDVGGSATIHTYGGTVANASPYVAVHLHSAHAKVTGGTLIDLTALDMNDPATWCDYHGVRVSGGSAYLAKCVSLDFMAGQGNIPTRYPVDATVTAADWDPYRACGHGLHFSPTPAAARALYQGDFRSGFRFVECEVDLASMVVLGDQVKAPSCRVVREIGLDR